MLVQEFQAVVLAAGRGSRMTDITTGRPKCLLPVGGMPLLWHSLNILERAGFQDAIVLVLETAHSEIEAALENCNLHIKVEMIDIPSESGEDWGTADSLRFLLTGDKIKTDIVLVSCDLFTDENLNNLLNMFRKHSASFAALMFQPSEGALSSEPIPGPKTKYKPEKDIIGIDSETSQLLFLASASDFEENVPISRLLLRHHYKLTLRTDLLDSHLYILSHGLAKYLVDERSFSTLKGEFFPYVVSKQYIKQSSTNEVSTSKKDILQYLQESESQEKIRRFSTYIDHSGDLKDVYRGDIIRCYAVISTPNHYGIRVNSVQALCQANHMYLNLEKQPIESLPAVHPTAIVQSNQVDENSYIGKHAEILEKTSIKGCVIGENSKIMSKTRLSKCILMKGVEIGEGCVLQNCIVCDGAKISPNCDLKDCIIGAYHNVASGTKTSAQVLTKSDRLMEI